MQRLILALLTALLVGLFALAATTSYTIPVTPPTWTDGYLIASSATGFKSVRDFLVLYQGAARCQGASAITFWNVPNGSTAASPQCSIGTNVIRATLDYIDASNHTAQIPFYLPSDFDATGAVSLEIYWSTTATSGDVIFSVETTCVGVSEPSDPAYNAAQTVTDTADASTGEKNVATIASLTMTGCAAGEVLFIRLDRNGATTGDTIAATASVIATELKYFRKW